MNFFIVFRQVLLMLAYLSCGYLLAKAKLAVPSHAKTMSGFLIYICCPCMIIDSFQQLSYNHAEWLKILMFFGISLLAELLFLSFLWLIYRRKMIHAEYRILTVGAILGNVGFFGLPLVKALFPEEPIAACYSMAFVISMNLLAFTLGIYMITRDKKYISLRCAIINPTTVAALIALPLYFTSIRLPAEIGTAVTLIGKMTTPLCMWVLGLRLAASPLRSVFGKPIAYRCCIWKLVVFPVFANLVFRFLPWFDSTFIRSLTVMCAAPAAAVILSLAELHECEQELSATVILLTTLLSIVSVPLLLLILA